MISKVILRRCKACRLEKEFKVNVYGCKITRNFWFYDSVGTQLISDNNKFLMFRQHIAFKISLAIL